MNLVGLDLNASRARGVAGGVGDFPTTIMLEPPAAELPLCLHLGSEAPVVGRTGLSWCRLQPHQVYHNFLPSLGEPADPGRRWLSRPHQLDAGQALGLVLRQLSQQCRGTDGVVLALPDYLTPLQGELATVLAGQAGLPVLGSLSAGLAVALAAHAEQVWFGTAVVLEVDDHALSLAVVQDSNGQAHLLGHATLPRLGLRVWKARLLNALADVCILQSRRDPRESSAAEQALFDQLDRILEDTRHGRLINVVFQTEHWYQNLVLQPEDTTAFCASLARQVVAEVDRIFQASWPKGSPRTLLLTAAAGLLPGLVPALQSYMDSWEGLDAEVGSEGEEDFGLGLLSEGEPGGPEPVVVLSPEAAARGAHAVAAHFQGGDLGCRHLDNAAPLPLPQPPEAGPARLQFQGQDYLLCERSFILGRQADCDLVFDRIRYAHVSPRHCEILYDPEAYQLLDHSREGTWVNDRPVTGPVPLHPGDCIRLGPDGPVLRFLGQAPTAGQAASLSVGQDRGNSSTKDRGASASS
jgi:hypothetical protein